LTVAALLAACSDGGDDDRAQSSTTVDRTTTTTTTATSSSTTEPTTTTEPTIAWPDLPTDGQARAVVTPTGIVLPVLGTDGDAFTVRTPCGNTSTVAGTPITGAHVVLDPGHGGEEPGAVGPNGLTEKEVNLAIAQQAKARLEAAGAAVVLTRTADYRIALLTRGSIATSLAPAAFVSIHHNAEPDGPWPRPGSETYYQIASPDSKRLAGLLWEELQEAFTPFAVAWVADTDAGAKYRPADDGGDYYGILRRTAGVPGVLSEAAFISNPPEEALLATAEFQAAEAQAVADAIVRFVTTQEPGSGFTEPYPRVVPAGSGGGTEGCEDPPLS
jgi:N-acetylmuramoyl-L-alanine amidase